jgi:hypothetical protein
VSAFGEHLDDAVEVAALGDVVEKKQDTQALVVRD